MTTGVLHLPGDIVLSQGGEARALLPDVHDEFSELFGGRSRGHSQIAEPYACYEEGKQNISLWSNSDGYALDRLSRAREQVLC